MPDYDPRTATGIPTEPVGSLPRPSWLQQAYARYDAGEITRAELDAEQDKAVADSIEHLEATGAPIISDGEQRWSSFATYAIADTLAGTGLADHLAGTGGQYFAIFADGQQLGSTDDCGFSPFSIDEKPNHGSPDFARETAWQKISNRVTGTRLAAERLGIG